MTEQTKITPLDSYDGPDFLILLFSLFFMRRFMQVGRNQMMNFSKSRPRRISADQPKVTFSDVAAADEAIQKLTEIKEFLKVPQRLQTLVGRIPKAPC